MTYVQLYNDLGVKIDEVEVKEGESILHAISESMWCLDDGDIIKIVEGEDEECYDTTPLSDEEELTKYIDGNRYANKQDAIDDLMWAFGFSKEKATECANKYFEEK